MRKGLTLIELIFSMVIIAIVFTVIPKMIFASNKAIALSIKEDGMYEAISLIGSISKLPWDENTTQSGGKILHTTTNDCDSATGYRIGGFVGSRNCIDSDYNVSTTLGTDANDNTYKDDVDDYIDYDQNSTQGRNYNLKVDINNTNNIKTIKVIVKGGAKTGNFQTSVFYESANLGYIKINKRAW